MFTYNTTRFQSVFDEWSTSIAISYSTIEDGAGYSTTAGSTAHAVESASNNQSYTSSSYSNSAAVSSDSTARGGEASTSMASASYVTEAGFTSSSWSSKGGTSITYNSSSHYTNTSSSSFSTTYSQGLSFETTTSSTQEYDYTVSTTYNGTTSIYTSVTTSFSVGTSVVDTVTLGTTSVTTNILSNQYSSYDTSLSTSVLVDATSSSVLNITAVTTSSITCSAPVELGTIVSAEGNDWLWSLTGSPYLGASDNTPYFATDIAESFTQETFWQTITTSVAPLTAGTTDYISYTNEDSTTGFTYEELYELTDTYSTTYTTGDMFPRGTSSTTFYSSTITTFSFTDGVSSNSDRVPATTTVSFTQQIGSTTTLTTLFSTNFDFSTTTLTVQTQTTSSYNETTIASNYFTTNTFSQTQASTVTFVVCPSYTVFSNSATIFQPVPEQGGMKTPDSMKQTDGAGANLSFSPSIYYPFTSSVQQNVIVPVKTGTFTTQVVTDSSSSSTYNWVYSWSSYTLYFTSASSYTSVSGTETVTVWSSSSASGTFETESAQTDTFWQDGNTAFGGYSPISTEAEIGLFEGGVFAYSYDTSGATSTDRTDRSSFETSTLSETVRAELQESLYVTNSAIGAAPPVLAFTR